MDALDRLAQELEQALCDPHNPTFCLSCVEQSISTLFAEEKQGHANGLHLQQNHHVLLTSIMNYMTIPRDEQDMAGLAASLLRTLATCTRCAKPSIAQGLEHLAPDAALRMISCVVRVCLESSSKLLRTHLFSRRGVWPRSTEDIIPRGPRESVIGLLFWLNRFGRHRHWAPMTTLGPLFGYVFRICCFDLIPILDTDDMRIPFIDMICQQLDLATSVLREGGDPAMHSHERMSATADVIYAVSHGGEHGDAWISIVRGEQSRIIDALAAAVDSVDGQLFPEVKNQLLSLQYGMHLTIGPGHRVPQSLADEIGVIHSFLQDVRVDLHIRLNSVEVHTECKAPDCRKHARQTPTGKLQRCGGCRLYKYCSPECQRRHWSVQNPPHRRLCKKLKELFAVAQFTLATPPFVAACKASSFPETFYREILVYLDDDLRV